MRRSKETTRLIQVAGIEWCTNLDAEIQANIEQIGCLELIPENFFQDLTNFCPKKIFQVLYERKIPVIVHSIGLSLGSLEPFKESYFGKILEIADQVPSTVSLSDHLCMTERNGSAIGQLTTIPYNEDTLDCVTKKLELIRTKTDVPFAIENITHCFVVPGQELTETQFINQLIERTGVDLLLDLNNIYTNGSVRLTSTASALSIWRAVTSMKIGFCRMGIVKKFPSPSGSFLSMLFRRRGDRLLP
jgi:uncharacterized protein (UPF0276 family)